MNSPSRKSGTYFKLIRQILIGVRGGISRNQFLAELFDRLESTSNTSGYVVLIEGYPKSTDNLIDGLKVAFSHGPSPHRIRNLTENIHAYFGSKFIYSVLAHGRSHDFILRSYALEKKGLGDHTYRDEFADLHGKNETWLCSVALPAKEPGEPERALFAIYPVPDQVFSTKIPRGAEIEWDSLVLLPDIFTVLQNKVRTLQEQVEREQNQMIAELTPSAIAHEMGTNLNLVLSSITRISEPVRSLMNELGEQRNEVVEIIDELIGIQNRTDKALTVASAFTNLQRKSPRSEAIVQDLVNDIEIVLGQRLGRAGISFAAHVDPDLTITSDIRFIEHILMNVLINAIEAIEPEIEDNQNVENNTSAAKRFHIRLLVNKAEENIHFIIANDGPEIPREISPRIFEVGVTSKPIGTGHGQGLSLCLQIANHLGGSFGFGRYPKSDFDPTVVFKLDIPARAEYGSDS